MEERTLKCWEEFDDLLRRLDAKRAEMQDQHATHISDFLFRGQGDSKWTLESTLDRFFSKKVELKEYYNIVSAINPRIETFTGEHWNILSSEEYRKWVDSHIENSVNLHEFKEYEYLAYLRHHGFPSPLLDWTESPYIAAFFAFNGARDDTGEVSVFVYCEYAGTGKMISGGKPYIYALGPYIRTHKRHFFQQSRYTVCVVEENNKIYYAKHDDVIAKGEKKQDLLWKINLPKRDRRKAFASLQRMNINSFSLFGSEDSLMQTLATTEILLKGRDSTRS